MCLVRWCRLYTTFFIWRPLYVTKPISRHALSSSLICWFRNLPCEKWVHASCVLKAKLVTIDRPSSSERSLLLRIRSDSSFHLAPEAISLQFVIFNSLNWDWLEVLRWHDLFDINLLSVRGPWLTQHLVSLKCLWPEFNFL